MSKGNQWARVIQTRTGWHYTFSLEMLRAYGWDRMEQMMDEAQPKFDELGTRLAHAVKVHGTCDVCGRMAKEPHSWVCAKSENTEPPVE